MNTAAGWSLWQTGVLPMTEWGNCSPRQPRAASGKMGPVCTDLFTFFKRIQKCKVSRLLNIGEFFSFFFFSFAVFCKPNNASTGQLWIMGHHFVTSDLNENWEGGLPSAMNWGALGEWSHSLNISPQWLEFPVINLFSTLTLNFPSSLKEYGRER